MLVEGKRALLRHITAVQLVRAFVLAREDRFMSSREAQLLHSGTTDAGLRSHPTLHLAPSYISKSCRALAKFCCASAIAAFLSFEEVR